MVICNSVVHPEIRFYAQRLLTGWTLIRCQFSRNFDSFVAKFLNFFLPKITGMTHLTGFGMFYFLSGGMCKGK